MGGQSKFHCPVPEMKKQKTKTPTPSPKSLSQGGPASVVARVARKEKRRSDSPAPNAATQIPAETSPDGRAPRPPPPPAPTVGPRSLRQPSPAPTPNQHPENSLESGAGSWARPGPRDAAGLPRFRGRRRLRRHGPGQRALGPGSARLGAARRSRSGQWPAPAGPSECPGATSGAPRPPPHSTPPRSVITSSGRDRKSLAPPLRRAWEAHRCFGQRLPRPRWSWGVVQGTPESHARGLGHSWGG